MANDVLTRLDPGRSRLGKRLSQTTLLERLLIASILIALAGVVCVTALLIMSSRGPHDLTPDEWSFFLDAYKAIGIGFLTALLGVVIPQLVPEARDRFERFKGSRIAYSQAKTSVIYLPEVLACLGFRKAVLAVQKAHENLHLAETYPKELKAHLHWHPHPGTWVDRNYWELFAMRKVLEEHVEAWPRLSSAQRLRALRKALATVEEVFGRDNDQWMRLPRAARERNIEDLLCSRVATYRV